MVKELAVMQFLEIKENSNGGQLGKKQELMPKEKLKQPNLEDIMIEEIYQLKLIIKEPQIE